MWGCEMERQDQRTRERWRGRGGGDSAVCADWVGGERDCWEATRWALWSTQRRVEETRGKWQSALIDTPDVAKAKDKLANFFLLFWLMFNLLMSSDLLWSWVDRTTRGLISFPSLSFKAFCLAHLWKWCKEVQSLCSCSLGIVAALLSDAWILLSDFDSLFTTLAYFQSAWGRYSVFTQDGITAGMQKYH